MTPYQETLLALATESESAALELWWRVGELGDDLFRAALAAILTTYNQRAISLAVTAFSLQASTATGVAVPTALPEIVDDTPRLVKAANTVLDVARASDVPDDIIARLARAEPLNTAARTYSGQLADSTLVEGWTRNMDADPCQLCRWWWREGRIWPKQHPFQTHTGCACVPRPVWAKNIKSTGYTRQLRETA